MVPWHFLLWYLAATGGAAAVTGVASAAPQAFWDWLLGEQWRGSEGADFQVIFW